MNPLDTPAANDEGAAAALTEMRQILLGDLQQETSRSLQLLQTTLAEQAGRLAELENRCRSLEQGSRALDERLADWMDGVRRDIARLELHKADRQALSAALRTLAGELVADADAATLADRTSR